MSSGTATPPSIEVRGLRVLGVHGVLESEKIAPQPFEVDIEVWFDTESASKSDDLSDTVNYAELAHRAEKIVSSESYELLEALSRRIALDLLGFDPRMASVCVTIAKLRPPIPLDVDRVVVRYVAHSKDRN